MAMRMRFSEAGPWLPVPASFKTHNVEAELKDPDSILQFYRHVLALRHEDAALREGEYIPLNEDQPNVVSYLRRYKGEAELGGLDIPRTGQEGGFKLKHR